MYEGGYGCTLYQLLLLTDPVYRVYGMCVVLLGIDGMNRSIALKNPGDEICGGYDNTLCPDRPVTFSHRFDLSEGEFGWLPNYTFETIEYRAGVGFIGTYNTQYYPKTGVSIYKEFGAIKVSSVSIEAYIPTISGNCNVDWEVNLYAGSEEIWGPTMQELFEGEHTYTGTHEAENITKVMVGTEAACINSEYIIRAVTINGSAAGGDPF
jgi:hypothetical protein